jgi:hypothetical protein
VGEVSPRGDGEGGQKKRDFEKLIDKAEKLLYNNMVINLSF